jgi:exodeoxyribonuclease-3
MKIITWNVNSINVRLPHLLELIKKHDPDIICLQELKCDNSKFPKEALEHLPYNLYYHGQKSYNGVAILSKLPAENIKTEFPGNPLPDHSRFIEIDVNSSIGYSKIISLYAPNGGEVGSDKFISKLEFYDNFTKYLIEQKSFDHHIFIGSDYNIAPFDIDVYSPDKLRHSTCFTIEEQKKLRTILNSGFVDTYRLINPDSREYSWWDYRAGAFEQNKGMRIDSIITSTGASKYLLDSEIDYQTRGLIKPSDHAPVISSFAV